jgi:hypothetical protein
MGAWPGTETVATRSRIYHPFKETPALVRSLGLKSQSEWRAYCNSGNKPKDIPRAVLFMPTMGRGKCGIGSALTGNCSLAFLVSEWSAPLKILLHHRRFGVNLVHFVGQRF